MAQVIYTIDDAKLAEFKLGFLKYCPLPLDEDSGDPLCSENEWIKEWGKKQFTGMYKRGKQKLAEEIKPDAVIEEDIIT